MNWTVTYYGVPNPSLSRKITIHVLMTGLILIPYAFYTDFIPTKFWDYWGLVLAIGISFVVTAWLYLAYGTGHLKMAKGASTLKKALALSILPFMLAGMLWIDVVHAIPDIATIIFGNQHEESAELYIERSSNHRECRYRLDGHAFARAFPDYYCISPGLFKTLSMKPLPMVLKGKKTQFGFHVSSIHGEPDEILRRPGELMLAP